MGKFNAGSAVEAMEFDFTDYGGRSGVIPEPTSAQLDEFMDAVVSLQAEYKDILGASDTATETELEELASRYEGVSAKDIQDKILDAVGQICNGTPSAEELVALPYRVQQAFMGWLIGELRPEAAATTSKR